MTGADSVTQAKGVATAEIARRFFGVQLRYADVLSARTDMPLADAVIWHTNFHRLFAYGNLAKQAPDAAFASLVHKALAEPVARLDVFVAAFADRPHDPWPADRFPVGKHFACEAPNSDGAARIHFRNRWNGEEAGPLHASNIAQRRADLAEMFAFIAARWPETKAIIGGSWLYNTKSYCGLFPPEYIASRTPLVGLRPTHGLSTWGQFLDFRGHARPHVVEAFERNLETLDVNQPWLSFPYQVLSTSAPFAAFRREYGV